MRVASTIVAVTVLVGVLVLVVVACPKPSAEGEGGEGEGEGEGGLVCAPPCTAEGTGCAFNNCNRIECAPIVTTEGAPCSTTSDLCAEGGTSPCSPGQECTSIAGAAVVCVAAGEDGAACEVDQVVQRDGCADGFVCLPKQAVCAPACAENGTCPGNNGSDECIAGACFPQSPEGGPCPLEAATDFTGGDGCLPGLRCGFEATGAGPQCIQDECSSDTDCPGGVCVIQGCVQDQRVCGALLDVGAACFAGCAGDGCSNFTQNCAEGLECMHVFDQCPNGGSTGTCVVPGNGSCSVTHDAATDGCADPLECDQTALSCL